MSALVIGEAQRRQIAELRAFAAANPMDAMASDMIAQTDIDAYRDMMETLSIDLPVGFHVTYTHERQPNAPTPTKLCHHISISVEQPKKMPLPEAVEMILLEFGMKPMREATGVWLEDIDRVTAAVNIVQLI